MTTFEKSRNFIYRNARPIDLARWQFHFENGSWETVLTALAAYQNEDGGFAHALEADSFNPNSTPIQTWMATEMLREIGFEDRNHSIIRGILRYLSSGADFDRTHRQWLNTVPSNDNYPHAIWWAYQEDEDSFRYNPTAALAGFYLKFAEPSDPFYETALALAREAFRFFVRIRPYSEQHVTACFIRLYEYCKEAGVQVIDMAHFQQLLAEQVSNELSEAADHWEEYVCMPSKFISSKNSIFLPGNEDLVRKECVFIETHQLPDGSFPIPWRWWTEYPEFELSANWWRSDRCIRKMQFLKEFSDF